MVILLLVLNLVATSCLALLVRMKLRRDAKEMFILKKSVLDAKKSFDKTFNAKTSPSVPEYKSLDGTNGKHPVPEPEEKTINEIKAIKQIGETGRSFRQRQAITGRNVVL